MLEWRLHKPKECGFQTSLAVRKRRNMTSGRPTMEIPMGGFVSETFIMWPMVWMWMGTYVEWIIGHVVQNDQLTQYGYATIWILG